MIVQDATAQGTDADLLRQQLLQAQRLSSVGTLASSVAHEFNNILTTIINYAKLGLRSPENGPARTEALEKILKGSQRAATIVNSMLGFARNNATQREMTDLAGLANEVLILTEKDLSKHQVQVEKRFQTHIRAPVVPGQIEQILLNLIINARQAMPRGGKLRIEIRENPTTQMAEICVSDTGVGIPPDEQERVFEKFRQAARSTLTREHEGTGLGLSIVRELCGLLGGDVGLQSDLGRGSTFTVRLPRNLEMPTPAPPRSASGTLKSDGRHTPTELLRPVVSAGGTRGA